MSARVLVPTMLVAVVAIVLVLILTAGGGYRVRLELTTATGLRQGSQVKVGGVAVGKIDALRLGRGDVVVADLTLDDDKGGIGPGASASIVASNLLGSKFVQLDRGDTERELPSGTRIASSRVDYPVDLDEILNVLDPDTRTRLQVLLNETGVAVTGRQQDINQTLRLLPPSLEGGARMLAALDADNGALERTVKSSSGLVDRLTGERAQLTRVVESADGVLATTAQKQAALRETLARAPATLRTARRVLTDLEATTKPLKPAAQAISATAPALTDTLTALPGFQDAAEPALTEAVAAAPKLTRLARGATPVLRDAKPTLVSLANFARTSKPLTDTLRVSIDDALGLIEGWARSIQTRDRLGHVFRGRAIIPVDTVQSLVSRLVPKTAAEKKSKSPPPLTPRPSTSRPESKPGVRPSVPAVPKLPLTEKLPDLPLGLDGVLKGEQPAPAAPPASTDDLLDFLLGS